MTNDEETLERMRVGLRLLAMQRPGLKASMFASDEELRRARNKLNLLKKDFVEFYNHSCRSSCRPLDPKMLATAARVATNGKLEWNGSQWVVREGVPSHQLRFLACAVMARAVATAIIERWCEGGVISNSTSVYWKLWHSVGKHLTARWYQELRT